MSDLSVLDREAAEPRSRRRVPSRLMLTVEEAAESLGVGRTTMYALVRSGRVESIRIGRLRRVPADALNAFVVALRNTGAVV